MSEAASSSTNSTASGWRRRTEAGQAVVDRAVERGSDGRRLLGSGHDERDHPAGEDRGHRHGQREPGHVLEPVERAVADLLAPARVVDLDRLDRQRVVEVGDVRIVEREVAVLADADQREVDPAVGEQRAVARASAAAVRTACRRRAARPARGGRGTRCGRRATCRTPARGRAAGPTYSSRWNASTRDQSMPSASRAREDLGLRGGGGEDHPGARLDGEERRAAARRRTPPDAVAQRGRSARTTVRSRSRTSSVMRAPG